MRTMSKAVTTAAALTVLCGGIDRAQAEPAFSFHTFVVSEVYSNTDGSVQFIELKENLNANLQNFFSGHSITASSTDGSVFNEFFFPSNLPSTTTAGKRVLLATAGFAGLPGGVAPDYVIPANFIPLLPGGAGVNFAGLAGGADVAFASLPADGSHSLVFPGGTQSVNSPQNFAGASGSVNLPPTTTGACCNSTACTITSQSACTGGGGVYQGNNSACGPIGNPTTCCPANFNLSGGVSVQDIFDFLGVYFDGLPVADFNGVGGVTVQDIFDYLSAYFLGC